MRVETEMNGNGITLYRINEFAELAGVTVRALHHYDRLGLLKPTARTGTKYRLYSDSDLVRLEQIVVLKFLGMSLKEIGSVIDREASVASALERQQRVLADKRRQLDYAMNTIAQAGTSLKSHGRPDWKLFRQIIQEIEMQNTTDWSRKYYSDEAKAKIEERRTLWNPELQAQVTKDWNELFADIQASLDEDPASEKAQQLAARWKTLLAGFTGGDPEIQKGLNKMYADRDNWPAAEKERVEIKPEIWGFIQKAFAAGK
jgi:MerR family transcriptional regulator, thiopeptide resistance regulator